jgi:hypothetical protein
MLPLSTRSKSAVRLSARVKPNVQFRRTLSGYSKPKALPVTLH